jgi:hypothetical protein
VARRPAVTLLAIAPDDATRWLEVRGTVVGETEEGANEHIDALVRLYLGVDTYPFHQAGDVRVLFKIAPLRVATLESTRPNFRASTCPHGGRYRGGMRQRSASSDALMRQEQQEGT